jgi:hypothetical protein
MLLISGCNKEAGMGKKEIEKKASSVAAEYLMVEEDIDFVVTNVEIIKDEVGAAFVNGYVKEDKKKKMYVMINYLDEFKVSGYGILDAKKKE